MIDPVPRPCRWLGAVLAATTLAGCSRGPEIGAVGGTVTYNGQTLAGIKVTFDPRAGGRSSTGLTGADGRYHLNYTRERKGALIGTHDVRVNWPAQTAEDLAKRDKYPISSAYNTATTITFDVKRGSNTCDVSIRAR